MVDVQESAFQFTVTVVRKIETDEKGKQFVIWSAYTPKIMGEPAYGSTLLEALGGLAKALIGAAKAHKQQILALSDEDMLFELLQK